MRLVIVGGALGALAILVLQNLSVVLPLVILGQPVVALPVGVWMGIAIATGVLTNGLLVLIGSPVPQRRREPELRPGRSPGRRESSRRQTVESMAEEIWDEEGSASDGAAKEEDEWSVAAQTADAGGGSGRRSRRIPKSESAGDEELEEVIGGWNEPNRSRQGWDYEPEWDEDEAWTQPGTGVRRRPPRDRPRPKDRQSDNLPVNGAVESGAKNAVSNPIPAREGDNRGRAEAPPSELRNFEKQRPLRGEQTGSTYSYSYRNRDDGSGDRADGSADKGDQGKDNGANGGESEETSRPEPLITPPPAQPNSSFNPPVSPAPPIRAINQDDDDEPLTVPERSRPEISPRQRAQRPPLNLPPESEAPKPSQPRKSVMDADYRVIRPADPDYDGRSPDDWDRQEGDWEDW
ncbi:MAG: hypothetical protein AAF685_15930 [Cyanobacteria bacterium P01_C01_bin.89]